MSDFVFFGGRYRPALACTDSAKQMLKGGGYSFLPWSFDCQGCGQPNEIRFGESFIRLDDNGDPHLLFSPCILCDVFNGIYFRLKEKKKMHSAYRVKTLYRSLE